MNDKTGGRALFMGFQKGFATILTLGLLAVAGGLAQEKTTTETKGLKLGAKAPDFSLLDSTGEKRSLVDFLGKKHVALVFYPALFRSGA